MTDKEALKLALDALENLEHSNFKRRRLDALIAIKQVLAQPVQPDTDMAYTIALQRAIEWHCDGKAVPPDVAEVCPYHAEMLNKTLAQPVQREWVGLTGEDFSAIKFPAEMRFPAEFRAGARWAEAKLKEKNFD